jgi:hypothetical protein
MDKLELKTLLKNDDIDADDNAFRGSLERFLLAAALGLKGLALGGTTEIDKLYQQMFAGLNPPPITVASPEMAAKREAAVVKLLTAYGFSKAFIRNVVSSDMIANDTLFTALLTLKTTKMFADAYSGAGCVVRMKKMVKIARALEKPKKRAKG